MIKQKNFIIRIIRLKFFQKLFGYFLILNSLAIFSYSSVGMVFWDLKETKISENVVLRFDVPTEYVGNDAFWWLLEGQNQIKIVNFSDENHEGTVFFSLQQNPCLNAKKFEINNLIYFTNKNSEVANAHYRFSIKPNDEISIILNILNDSKCNIKGEDKRNFGLKLVGWTIS